MTGKCPSCGRFMADPVRELAEQAERAKQDAGARGKIPGTDRPAIRFMDDEPQKTPPWVNPDIQNERIKAQIAKASERGAWNHE